MTEKIEVDVWSKEIILEALEVYIEKRLLRSPIGYSTATIVSLAEEVLAANKLLKELTSK